jgi:serine/threonine protein kinase
MEKLDMDLDEAIREEKVPNGRQNPQMYADIMRGIVSALAYLHFRVGGKPVVHRDLKPKNVMLDGNKVPKLIDFGLAKETEGGIGSTFQKIGTDEWMAPEQKSNGGCSTASDMYAVGMIGHFVLQGLTPNEVKELRVHVSGNEQADLTQRLMIACSHEVNSSYAQSANCVSPLATTGSGEISRRISCIARVSSYHSRNCAHQCQKATVLSMCSSIVVQKIPNAARK